MSDKSTLAFANTFLKKYRFRLALAVFWSAVFIVVPMQIPILTGALVDGLNGKTSRIYGFIDLNHSPEKVLIITILTLIAVALFYGISGYLRTVSTANVSRHFVSELRKALIDKIDRMSLDLHHNYGSGELLNRTLIDTRSMRRFIESVYIKSVTNVLRVIYPAVMLFIIDPFLAFITCSVVPVQWTITSRLQKRLHKASKKQRKTQSKLTNIVKENLDGIETVKTSNIENDSVKKICSESEKLENDALATNRYTGMITAATWALTTTGLALTWWMGGLKVLSGEMTIGTLIVFTGLAVFIYAPFRRFTSIVNVYHTGIVALERIQEILNLNDTIKDKPGAKPLTINRGEIEFRSVTFKYGSNGCENILKNVSFLIEPEKMTAIVGKSGSGKSSILKLITKLYDPQEGDIYIDGKNIKLATQDSIRSQIAVVPQNPIVFSESVFKNIVLSCPDASIERVKEACRSAGALEFIENFENGFNTKLGQGGINLSGGQIQRIAIARALLREPKILLLDEPVSALDSESLTAVMNSLELLKGKMTIIVVAHNLKTINKTDKIIVMKEGRVSENSVVRNFNPLTQISKQLISKGNAEYDFIAWQEF